jgi:thymidylate synthase
MLPLEYETPGEAAATLPLYVMRNGDSIAPRGMMTFEELHAHIIIHRPWFLPFDIQNRNLRHDISRLEITSLCGQTPVDSAQRFHVPAVAMFQDYAVQWGNYGARIRGQIPQILERLAAHGSRQAVLTIFNSERDIFGRPSDVPCTLSMQFLIRKDRLITRTSMRSNDVYLGLPYDLHQFCALHCMIAQIMEVQPGEYHHLVGSLHAYERDEEGITKLGRSIDHGGSPTLFANWRAYDEIIAFLQDSVRDAHMKDGRGDTPFEIYLNDWGT